MHTRIEAGKFSRRLRAVGWSAAGSIPAPALLLLSSAAVTLGRKTRRLTNANFTQEDTATMKSGYPHFRLYTWIEDKQIWVTEEGGGKQLRRIPESVRSDLKRGKCRVFSDVNGNNCYAMIDGVASQQLYRSRLGIPGLE